jgi:hypothetical protein
VVYNHSSQQFTRFKAGTISINLPAKTGNDNNNNTAVITTAHPNKASFAPQKNKRLSNKTLLILY